MIYSNSTSANPIDAFINSNRMVKDLVDHTCVKVYYFHDNCTEEFFVVIGGKRYYHWSYDCGVLTNMHCAVCDSDYLKNFLAALFVRSEDAEVRAL